MQLQETWAGGAGFPAGARRGCSGAVGQVIRWLFIAGIVGLVVFNVATGHWEGVMYAVVRLLGALS